MDCPVCGSWSIVLETRQRKAGFIRRRLCGNEHKFSTEEVVVTNATMRANRQRKKAASAKTETADVPI
jgi:DNA-directed RNA polymerase subunit M/transcription elongation factor TFIIS